MKHLAETMFNLTYKVGEDKLMDKFGLGVQDLTDIVEQWSIEFGSLYGNIDWSTHSCSYYDQIDDFYSLKLQNYDNTRNY